MSRVIVLTIFVLLSLTGVSVSVATEETHWDYEGQEGPENWGALAGDYDICARGRNQSPIDLVADFHSELPKLELDYTHLGIEEINTGHAIQE